MIWEYKFFELLGEDKRLAWDYVTALRACDIPNLEVYITNIKLFCTAPIRGRMCNALDQQDTFSRCKHLRDETDLINLIKDLKYGISESSPHYKIHAAKGYEAIQQNKIGRAIKKTSCDNKVDDKYIWEIIWRVNNFVRKSLEVKNR